MYQAMAQARAEPGPGTHARGPPPPRGEGCPGLGPWSSLGGVFELIRGHPARASPASSPGPGLSSGMILGPHWPEPGLPLGLEALYLM